MNSISRFFSSMATLAVRGYQLILSPFLPNCCRYAPSCSHYAIEAIERHGALRGGYLSAARLLRCHPWASWGFDPVPENFTYRPWRKPSEQPCQRHHDRGACHVETPT